MTHERSDDAETGEPDLDPLLAAAFGPHVGPARSATPPGDGGASDTIADALAAIRAGAQRTTLRLRDGAGTEGAPADPAAPGASPSDRYQTHEEIARGGMGIVYRGEDRDLGREVAIKVLRDPHSRNPAMLQRFIEEAQIIGQLQHPGFVPIHELGVGRDGRPFFAMKHIEGTTLAARLAARRDRSEDHLQMVRVFEQICQAVAYAHAHGVIHRDLKPQNVMVGAFGEVVVLDWGLAKVLASAPTASTGARVILPVVDHGDAPTPSQPHTVLGTPGYCAPEQARGEVAAMDLRTDVFGLGAILCEILTGRPPYGDGGRDDLLAKARAADLGDAWVRLAACSAEPPLVELARLCLAPEREARPADARVVATTVGEYLASVAARARAAEIAVAEERAARQAADGRARAERRSRRLTVALAGVGIVVVALGGTGLWWLDIAARDRAALRVRTVQAAVDEAQKQVAVARALGPEAVEAWVEAGSAARRAAALAEDGGLDATVAASARSVRDAITVEAAHAQQVREQLARDRAFVARRRDPISMIEPDSIPLELGAWYESAFEDYGLDLRRTPPAKAAESVAASAIKDRLIEVIDLWIATLLEHSDGRPDVLVERLAEVVWLADPDPWRTELRAATRRRLEHDIVAGDNAVFVRLAAEVDLDREQAVHIRFLAAGQGKGRVADSVALLKRAALRKPRGFNSDLAAYMASLRPPRHDEAVRYATAVVATSDSLDARLRLGGHLLRAGRPAEAQAVFAHATERWPDDYRSLVLSSVGLRRLGRDAESVARLEQARRLGQPSRAGEDGNLVVELILCEELDLALAQAEELVAASSEPARLHVLAAGIYSRRGDHAAAAAAYERAIATGDANRRRLIQLGAELQKAGRLPEAAAALRRAVAARPGRHSPLCELGVVLFEIRAPDAREILQQAAESDPACGKSRNLLALLARQDGDLELALDWAERARAAAPQQSVFASNRVRFLIEAGRFADAEAAARDVTRRWPTDLPAQQLLGEVCEMRGDGSAAAEAYRALLRLAPDHEYARRHLVDCLRQEGSLEEALAALRERSRVAATPEEDPLERVVEVLERALGYSRAETPADPLVAGDMDVVSLAAHVEASHARRRFVAESMFLHRAIDRFPGEVSKMLSNPGEALVVALVRAADGEGEDAAVLSQKQRRELREVALERLTSWLLDLEALDEPTVQERGLVEKVLRFFAADRRLDSVRDAAALERLDEAERTAWGAFWRRTRAVHKRLLN